MLWTILYILDNIIKGYLNITFNLTSCYELVIIEINLINTVYWGYYWKIFRHLLIIQFLLVPLLLVGFIITVIIKKFVLIMILMINNRSLNTYYDYPFDGTWWQLFNILFKNIFIVLLTLLVLTCINNIFVLPKA